MPYQNLKHKHEIQALFMFILAWLIEIITKLYHDKNILPSQNYNQY